MPDGLKFPYTLLQTMEQTLDGRATDLARLVDYHAGKHRLAFTSEKFRTAFGGLFGSFADNFIPLVVDSVEERLNVQGFRYGDKPASDKEAWTFWQENNLDAQSQLAHREALIKGDAFAIVWKGDNNRPRVTVESAEQCVVAFAPGDRTDRVAALKRWTDGDGKHAILFTKESVFRFIESSADGVDWAPDRGEDPDWPMPNPLEKVPVVPLTNRPSLTSPYGVSEFLNVIPIQDAINKVLADMLVASEYTAFPQRYATGLELEEDDQGRLKAPFEIAVDKLLTAEDPNAKFGTLEQGDLENYIKAVDLLVQHLSTETRTPPHYFNVGGNLPSGDAIKAAETGLVAKARRKMRFFGESWEEVIRLCFAVVEDVRADVVDGETVWADPEYRSESELADALVKRSAIGVPRQQLWEDAGYSPQQIARFKEMEAEDALNSLLNDVPVGIPTVPRTPVVQQF
ncbi:MAG: phage portal protein [Pseudolysinimonas sp.]